MPAAQSAFCSQNIFIAHRTLPCGLVSIFHCQRHYSVVELADYSYSKVFSKFCSQHKAFCPFTLSGGAQGCTKLYRPCIMGMVCDVYGSLPRLLQVSCFCTGITVYYWKCLITLHFSRCRTRCIQFNIIHVAPNNKFPQCHPMFNNLSQQE